MCSTSNLLFIGAATLFSGRRDPDAALHQYAASIQIAYATFAACDTRLSPPGGVNNASVPRPDETGIAAIADLCN